MVNIEDEQGRVSKQLLIQGLVKQFGAVKANDGLSIEFRTGEFHALLGENGAGKSTLIKILSGIYQPDSGLISLDGDRANFRSATAARAAGISVVHQDSTLCSKLSVLENVVLQEGGLGPISSDLAQRLQETGDHLGFTFSLEQLVELISPGDRQRVEIARALMVNANFLILDEPTAVLSPKEKDGLFTILRDLVSGGLGVILVTHHIGDALQHSDYLTVLRAGRVVERPRIQVAELDVGQVVKMMVGDITIQDQRTDTYQHDGAEDGDEVLRIENLTGKFEGETALTSVSLKVRRGEVLGIAGVEGDGQREIAAAATGAWKPEVGTIKLLGRDIFDYSPAERSALIADVPDDQLLGTVAEMSVWENVGLTSLCWHVRPTPKAKKGIQARTEDLVSEFGIRTASVRSPVGQLSGGNRRRVVLARELSKSPVLVVLAFASKGLDIRSVEQLKQWTRELARAGAAVIFISADLDEIFATADRVAVLAHGQITGTLDIGEADVHSVGRLMLGAASA